MRVMSVALAMSASRPLCSQERRYSGHADTAGLGQKLTSCAAAKSISYSITSSARSSSSLRHF